MTDTHEEQQEYVVAGGLPLSKLKDKQGRFRSNIFVEFNRKNWEEYPPVYTMHADNRRGLISARRVYLESSDEYEAAMKLVGSWQHWQKLLNNKRFLEGPQEGDPGSWEGVKAWREEMALRDKSMAKSLLIKNARAGNVSAQRLLYDGKEEKSAAGRPSNKRLNQEARRQVEESKIVDEGWERISNLKLAVNNGENS